MRDDPSPRVCPKCGITSLPYHPRPRQAANTTKSPEARASWSAPSRIGVGVDGASSGRDAVVFGSLLAKAAGAELLLIAVREEPLMVVAFAPDMDWAALEKQTRAMLAGTRDSLAPDARTVYASDTLVWRGLRRVVHTEHRDLLVVGSSGAASEGHVRLGDDARQLLTHLDCPLAVAPSGMADRKASKLRRIGVGFDGTPESRAALALGGAIASAVGAELHVRGVVNDRGPGGMRTEHVTLEGNAVLGEQLRTLLERELAAAPTSDAPIQFEVAGGSPAAALKEVASHVDLLAIGSSASAQPGRVQLGDTGWAVLQDAPCAMLIAPRPAAVTQSP